MRRELLLLLLISACGEDEKSSPRTSTPSNDSGTSNDASSDGGGGTDSSSPNDAGTDAPIVYPDPLQGTTKTATKVISLANDSFTEGPVWIGGRLLFSDIPKNVIQELLPDGGVSPFRTGTNGANGLAVDTQGRLWACQGGNKRVTRQMGTKGAQVDDVTTTYNAAAYNAPNDVIVRKDGNAYFTDPNYSGQADTQDARAVYRVSPTDQVTRLAGTFDQPNGIALSPDENTLYVVNNGTGKLVSATVNPDGTVGAFGPVADTPGGDGMGVDDAGNLYVTGNAGVLVFDKTGKSLGTITLAEQPANCTFGGPQRKTLYITARTSLYQIELNVPGLP